MRTTHPTVDEWGISRSYRRADGRWQTVAPSIRRAIRTAMGGAAPDCKTESKVRIIEPGDDLSLREPADLMLEDGTTLHCDQRLPRHLPFGYHELKGASDGRKGYLLVSPRACFLPKARGGWGWAIQLYALRSQASWGMGDLQDLRDFGRWSARKLHCDFILANPLGAASPLLPQQASPYFPGSRSFLNPLYLRVEEMPGVNGADAALRKLAACGQALNAQRLIDRDAVFKLKMEAFESLWKRFRAHPELDAFRRGQGQPLRQFATFCALARRFKAGWRQWPEPFRRPDSPAVRSFQIEQAGEIQFHEWLQWQADRQLAKAAGEIPLLIDLPVGVDPGGADAWVWQDLLAQDATVGAPPDAFNPQGQNWGLPPFIPHRLRAAGYEPFRQMVRAALRHGRGLRMDHVMGLFRLFWIPKNWSARDGAFVHYPFREMLAVLAIESQRAKALVVGEDLGTVEPQVRVELRRRKILSYRLLWFENRPVKKYPRRALASVGTHDLFTITGLWDGSDLQAQIKAGMRPDETETKNLLRRWQRRIGLREGTAGAAVKATYQLLAQSPSLLWTASLEDALEVGERPNLPGTTTQWPNWSLALPVPLETIKQKTLVKTLAQILTRRPKRQRGSTLRPPRKRHQS